MNSDQKLVAWMVVLLIGIVAWTTYKPFLKAVLFTAPASSGSGSSGGGGFNPWSLVNPWSSPLSPLAPFNPSSPESPLHYASNGVGSGGLPLTNVQSV